MEKLTKKNAQKWADALRSGKYQQGTGALEAEKGKYCCLGVACMLFIPESKRELIDDGRLRWAMPERQEFAPRWLKGLDKKLQEKAGIGFVHLNDSKEYSFDEIAYIIELVFVHGAMDEEPDNNFSDIAGTAIKQVPTPSGVEIGAKNGGLVFKKAKAMNAAGD